MTLRKNNMRALCGIMFGESESSHAVVHPERQKLCYHMKEHPWNFMTAVDPLTSEPLVWTRNENSERGRDPFPAKEYLRHYVEALVTEHVLLVPKSRQMIISTCTLVVCLWEIMFKASWRAILSKVTEDEAEELLENKVRYTYKHLPEWLRGMRSIEPRPKGKALCKETNSYILAAAQNAANRECRGGTANRLVVDEACYQDQFQEITEAGQPMTQHFNAISTPNVSYPGGLFMRQICYDEEAGL